MEWFVCMFALISNESATVLTRAVHSRAPLLLCARTASSTSLVCVEVVAASARLHTFVFSLSLLLAAVPSPRAPPGTRCFPSLACSRLLPPRAGRAVTGLTGLLRRRLGRLRLLPRSIPRRNTRTALLRALTPSSSTTATSTATSSTTTTSLLCRPPCPPHPPRALLPPQASLSFSHRASRPCRCDWCGRGAWRAIVATKSKGPVATSGAGTWQEVEVVEETVGGAEW